MTSFLHMNIDYMYKLVLFQVIVEASNGPLTLGAEQVLLQKDVMILPVKIQHYKSSYITNVYAVDVIYISSISIQSNKTNNHYDLP